MEKILIGSIILLFQLFFLLVFFLFKNKNEKIDRKLPSETSESFGHIKMGMFFTSFFAIVLILAGILE